MVLEMSVITIGRTWQGGNVHGEQEQRNGVQKETEASYIISKDISSIIYFLQLDPAPTFHHIVSLSRY